MGYGGYDHDAHVSSARVRATKPVEQVFTQRNCHTDMNPFGVHVRESRDSAEHPNSIAITWLLDVTGSMGSIPDYLARNPQGLPAFMGAVSHVIADPQVLFVAFGDAPKGDQSSLQVGQFESENNLMDRWLTSIHLEGGGWGNGMESYDLALYWASKHTVMDCMERRQKKGYLFMTGDECPYPKLSGQVVRGLIGTSLQQPPTIKEIVADVASTYHPFFLIPDPMRARYPSAWEVRHLGSTVEDVWRVLMGDHVVVLESHEDTSAASAVLVGLSERVLVDMDDVRNKLLEIGLTRTRAHSVMRAVEPFAAVIGSGGVHRPWEQAEYSPVERRSA
jgi:hypothetical protein